MNALERFVWDPDDLDWKNPSEKSGARRHSYRNLEKTLADLARKPQRTLRLVPQPLDALPNQENDERFETDWTEAKRVTKILAALFALSAAQEPISQEVRDKLGITDTDITAIANKLGKERAAEVMGLMWTPEGDLVQDPDAEKAITTTTENQVNEAVDAAVAAKLAPGDTWAPGQGPNDTPAADETTADEQLALDIAALFAFSAMRPDVVADMETGMLQNQLALTAYAAAGVSEVLVSDGTENDAPCILANGATWSIDYALNNLKEHPNAIMAGTRVLSLGAVQMAYRARWDGPLVSIETRSGNRLAIGPNHPVLTKRGWIPADGLRKGDHVVSRAASYDFERCTKPDFDDVEPVIEDVFETLSAHALSSWCVAAPTHFHGDGNFCKGDIEIVRPYRFLERVGNARFVQVAREGALMVRDVELAALASERTEMPLSERVLATARGSVCGFGLRATLADGQMRGAQDMHFVRRACDAEIADPLPRRTACHVKSDRDLIQRESLQKVQSLNCGVAGASPWCDIAIRETAQDRLERDTDLCSELRNRLALSVAFDEIVDVGYVDSFVGHAFDLSTDSRTYFANGILTHNCVRTFLPLGTDGMPLSALRVRRILEGK